MLKYHLKTKILLKIIDAFPKYNPMWVLRNEGEILSKDQKYQQQIPIYDVDVFFDNPDFLSNKDNISNYIRIPFFKADAGLFVDGDSMKPILNHGDIILIKKVKVDIIEGGKMYCIISKRQRIIKIVFNKKDGYELKSYNDNYENFEINKSDIIAVYPIVGSIKKFL